MTQSRPTDAEKAMGANAKSRVEQGVADDARGGRRAKAPATANPPSSTDLTGPGGDPAEGRR